MFPLGLGTLSSRGFPELGCILPTNKDFPDPISGDQKWNGAALILNKNPILKISRERFM